jgi:hypothetical protein
MEPQLLVHFKKEDSSEILKFAGNKSVKKDCYQFHVV